MTRAVDPLLLDDEAGQGPSSGRSLTASDPWSSGWVRPPEKLIEWRYDRAGRAAEIGRIPSQGATLADETTGPPPPVEVESSNGQAAEPTATPQPQGRTHGRVQRHCDRASTLTVSAPLLAEPTVELLEVTETITDIERPSPRDRTWRRTRRSRRAKGVASSSDAEDDVATQRPQLEVVLASEASSLVAQDPVTLEVDIPEWVNQSPNSSEGAAKLTDGLLAEFAAFNSETTTNASRRLEGLAEALSKGSLAVAIDADRDDDPPPPPPPDETEFAPTIDLDSARSHRDASDSRRRRIGTSFGAIYSGIVVTATAYWYYAIATLLIAIAVPFVAGWHVTTVMSGSMEPMVSPGDVVAFNEWDETPLGVGTIIQFEDQVRKGATTTHRIVGLNEDGSYLTKGDANANADSTPVQPEAIVGVATLLSPYAGLPQYWWGTRQLTWLGLWAIVTTIAFSIMTVHKRVEAEQSRRRPWIRAAIALGIVAALAGVGTAAWSAASFATATNNDDNQFGAGASFSDFTHHGSIGVATCAAPTSTTLVLGVAIPAGHTIVIRYAMRNRESNATLSASDTQGNSYSVDAHAVDGGRTQTAILSTYVTNALSSGDQITVTHSGGRSVVVSFDEFSGVAATGRVSAAGTATGNSTTPSVIIGVPDTDTLTVGSLSLRGTSTTTAPAGGNWTALSGGDVSCQRDMTHGGWWIESNLSGNVTFDPSLANTRRWAIAAVAYKSG